MNKARGGLLWLALPACITVVGIAGYAVGNGRAGMSRFTSLFAPPALSVSPADSTTWAKAVHATCGKEAGSSEIACYSRPLDSLAAVGEVSAAMSLLGEIQKLDADARRDGHVYAHMIGITAGKRGADVAKTFSMCNTSNQSGCYHGVIQAYFDGVRTVGAGEVNSLCQTFRSSQADQWLRFQCAHGTGHGLTMFHGHDLTKALAGCDFLTEEWDRRSCYGGAFMENIVNATMPHHPSHGLKSHDSHDADMVAMAHETAPGFKALDASDPLYPCSIMEERHLVSCYEMQTSVILHHNQGNIGAAAKTCDGAPAKLRHVCYQSLGRDISAYSLQDPVKSIQMCNLGTPRYQPWCFFGLVKNLVDLNARAADGVAFCAQLAGEANKMKCYEAVGEQVGTLRNELPERRKLCQQSEPAYLDACLFGARVGTFAPEALARINAAASGG